MGGAARPLHDPGNHRSVERGSNLQAARRGGLMKPAKPAGERENTAALTPSLGTRSGSPSTANKYARRGDIAFIGGGAILVIGLWIVGGLAYFDTLHISPPKPLAEKPTPSRVAEKLSPPAVAENPAPVPPSASQSDSGAAAPLQLPAVSPAEPAFPPAIQDNPPKPPESQPKPQPSLESQQSVVTTDQTPLEVDHTVDPAARELIAQGWVLYYLPYT